MEGIVESISAPKKSRNDKVYFVLVIGDDTFTLWEPTMIEGISVKDAVEFSYSESGSFKNITAIKLKEKTVDTSETIQKIETDYPIEFTKGTDVDTSNRVEDRLIEISQKLSIIIDLMGEKSSD